MSLKISASGFLATHSHYLEVEDNGIKFSDTAQGGSARWFHFHEVACVLMSENHTLSLQIGEEVISIPTKPGEAAHAMAVWALLNGVRRAHGLPPALAGP